MDLISRGTLSNRLSPAISPSRLPAIGTVGERHDAQLVERTVTQPTFSVLVSAYQTERYVEETIASVLAQTRGDWQLIVVDNGNSDEMAEIVRRYTDDPRVILVRQENAGISGGRNAAAVAATGRYFVCLDSDDRLLPSYLERMADRLDADPTLGAVCCDARVYYDEPAVFAEKNLIAHSGHTTPDLSNRSRQLEQILRENFLYSGGTIRAEAFADVGGFSDRVPGVEDWDMWIRLVAAGWGLAVIDAPLAIYRIRGDSTSRGEDKVLRFEDSVVRTLEIARNELTLGPRELAAVDEGLAFYRAMFARRRARVALANADTKLARTLTEEVVRLQPNLRSRAVLAALRIAPGLLSRMHVLRTRARLDSPRSGNATGRGVRSGSQTPSATEMRWNGRSFLGDTRTPDRILAHYLVERELADRLRTATPEERLHLYGAAYEEMFQRVPDHPQLRKTSTPEMQASQVASQIPALEHFVGPDVTFLEVGAGDCSLSIRLAPRLKQVYVLDVSPTIMAPAAGVPKITMAVSDGRNIPVPPRSIDLAYSNQLLEHLHPDDALAQIGEIVNAIAPGGRYLCVTPHRYNGPHDVSRGFGTQATGFHLREYTTLELKRLFKRAGFDRVTCLVGAKGRFVEVPVPVVGAIERVLSVLPATLRTRIAEGPLVRPFFGIRIVGRRIR